ncbi:hypothetical protein FGO68_gene11127 [Halteria grandinella]|uniref:Ankyrin repeat domain-containing protein n=1 Tax=Halteria grandinella TaxID=5974 RepID=A0A8J8NJR2_HALGN|nr:hypothetical protein FGO68_gene11127 [Halteria grandinella]
MKNSQQPQQQQQQLTPEEQFEQAKLYLWSSIQENNLHNIQVILNANFPVNQSLNPLGLTALHYAATNKYPQIMQFLLQPQYAANPNQPDIMGRTPLHMAAADGNVLVLNVLLLVAGIVIDGQSVGGETPLMRAVEHSKIHAVQVLLRAGANPFTLRNVSGLNALDIARITRNAEIETLLLSVAPQGYVVPVTSSIAGGQQQQDPGNRQGGGGGAGSADDSQMHE